MRTQSAAATHPGLLRTTNEDAFLATSTLALVADGMGGHACGEVASGFTIEHFRALEQTTPLATSDVVDAFSRANAAILTEAERHPEKAGMGTTLAGVALVDQAGSPHWLVFNVGDSRVYRVTDDTVRQLTVDHSEVAELVAAGRIQAEEAATHPLRNVITRSLGVEQEPVLDTWLIPAAGSETFLVCSDGLTGELSDIEIGAIVASDPDLASAAERLIQAALDAGGHDNVTVALLSGVSDDELGEDTASRTLPRPILTGGLTDGGADHE